MTNKIVAAISSLSKDWWIGKILVQYEAQYTWVALRFDDGTAVVLRVEEVSVGKWFEVFPLKVEPSLPSILSSYNFKWIDLPAPLQVCRVRSLWREEWLEPARDSSQFLGSGPHSVQYAARLGDAPADAIAFKVEAGIELQGIEGNPVVICSSDCSPFEIKFAIATEQIEKLAQFYTALGAER